MHWASVLTGATTYAEGRIQIRLLDFPCVAVTIDDLGRAHVDGFRRSGTPLFAHDAVGSHGPGQTAAAIIESRANPDRLRVAVYADDPTLGLGRDLPDGARGADLRTQHATRLAIADTRHYDGRPQTLQVLLPANEGCSALLGQTFMHSPQRMHRERKSDSSSALGGRNRRSFFSLAKLVVLRIKGMIAAPAAMAVRALRRFRSGPSTTASLGKNLKTVHAADIPRCSSGRDGIRPCARALPQWDRRHPDKRAGNGCSCRRRRGLFAIPRLTSAKQRRATRPADRSRGTKNGSHENSGPRGR